MLYSFAGRSAHRVGVSGEHLFTLPNFFRSDDARRVAELAAQKQLALGLDLRGGSHLLLQMDVEVSAEGMAETCNSDACASTLRTEPFIGIGVAQHAVNVRVTIRDRRQRRASSSKLNSGDGQSSYIAYFRHQTLDVEARAGTRIILTPTEAAINDRVTYAIGSASRRCGGVSTASAPPSPHPAQGRDRILVQVPGFEDPARLKELIGKTAKLTFHRFVDQTSLQASDEGPPAAGYRSTRRIKRDRYAPNYVLQKRAIVSGEDLVDAQPGFDQRTNEPVVQLPLQLLRRARFGKASHRTMSAGPSPSCSTAR